MILKSHILLVEDEPHLARVIKDSLEQQGYTITHIADGRKAFTAFQNTAFDLCIVDVMLPGTDGFTLVKQIRMQHQQVPVLFLTARSSTTDVMEGYASGGNDYLNKPFSLEELFLRVKELMRRHSNTTTLNQSLQVGRYLFTPHKQLLQLPGYTDIKLSHRETQLLQLLLQHQNQLLDRKLALNTLWGDDSFFNTRTMDVFITKLRKHLSHDPEVEILNLQGLGYKLIC
ncbi:response regulator transcription factor [Mucilaginibacter sp. CSA2-8R]|uniref:response regulator transcription factor n=1 Tax=Mucilaginibacter sp. CSA2-8R TaxID=3141542 RepID=UPI00315D02B4